MTFNFSFWGHSETEWFLYCRPRGAYRECFVSQWLRPDSRFCFWAPVISFSVTYFCGRPLLKPKKKQQHFFSLSFYWATLLTAEPNTTTKNIIIFRNEYSSFPTPKERKTTTDRYLHWWANLKRFSGTTEIADDRPLFSLAPITTDKILRITI